MTNQRAMDEASQYVDLQERLAMVPASAAIRGLYFGRIVRVLGHAGKLDEYRELFPERHSAIRWYPVKDYLVRLTVAGGILKSPAEVHQGMYEIGRLNAVVFAESLLGAVMLRLLSREPAKLLQQAVASRRQSATDGRWELRFEGPRRGVIEMTEEYSYIDSYLLGAAVGTFEAASVVAQVRAEVTGRFSGRHIIDW
jgi:uncharacterized protein (TIGR02265 family)